MRQLTSVDCRAIKAREKTLVSVQLMLTYLYSSFPPLVYNEPSLMLSWWPLMSQIGEMWVM